MRRIILFTCAVVLGGVAVKPTDAQTGERGSELAGEFLTAASVLADSVEHSCQVLGPTLWSPEAHEVGHCRDGGCSAAGTALHHDWVACQYERRWVLPASGSDPTDTVAENEVVLYRTESALRGADRGQPSKRRFTPVVSWGVRRTLVSKRPYRNSLDPNATVVATNAFGAGSVQLHH
jgi:hypothetical protein